MHMTFLNGFTIDQIDFARMQKVVRPLTPCGQRAFRARLPFISGQEAEWRADRADVEQLSETLGCMNENGKSFREHLVSTLSLLPDLYDVLQLLEKHEQLLVEHLASLKRFAYFAKTIEDQIERSNLVFPWWQSKARLVLNCFAKDSSSSSPDFSLAESGSPQLQEAYIMHNQIKQRRAELERELTKQVSRDYRVAVRRDQTLILPLDHMEPIEQAKKDSRLQMRMQTAFEIIFEPVWPMEHAQLSASEVVMRERVAKLEQESLALIMQQLAPINVHIQDMNEQVAHLDELLARVVLAHDRGYVWSELAHLGVTLTGGYPPAHGEFTPIDIALHTSVTMITGPNMGGKSVALKTLLLVIACHQYGYPVPAKAFTAPLVQHIRYVGGDGQSVQSGLSSFGAEIVAIQEALTLPQSMLCFDEIGRSTNPIEGSALLEAICSEIQRDDQRMAVVATHFLLTPNEDTIYYRMAGFRQDALQDSTKDIDIAERLRALQAAMDYRIVPQASGEVPQEGLAIAAWLGLSDEMIQHARRIAKAKVQV